MTRKPIRSRTSGAVPIAAATSADIDAEWHRWFAANRDVIGENANVIAPGQLLNPPASAQGGS